MHWVQRLLSHKLPIQICKLCTAWLLGTVKQCQAHLLGKKEHGMGLYGSEDQPDDPRVIGHVSTELLADKLQLLSPNDQKYYHIIALSIKNRCKLSFWRSCKLSFWSREYTYHTQNYLYLLVSRFIFREYYSNYRQNWSKVKAWL